MAYRYIHVLRTKAGEAIALGNLTSAAKNRMFPLVIMTKAVPATFLPSMLKHVAGHPIALSGNYNYSLSGSAVAFTALFRGLGSGGVPVIPVVGMNSDPGYITAASRLVGNFAPGIVLSAGLSQIGSALAWVTSQGWPPGEIDLLVQIGDVAPHEPVSFAAYVSHALNAAFPGAASPWRTVTLNSTAAPRDVGALPPGRSLVPRIEWQIWKAVYPAVGAQIDYSDWGHVNSSLEEVPGFAMANATVSVRYAIDDYWIVRKGRPTSGARGQPMAAQYRGHAIALIAEPQFDAVPGCWGDARIQHYASTAAGTGGRGQWAAILLNRHLSLTADILP